MSNPPTVPLPLVGMSKPHSMRIVVDLPEPFGPRKPKIAPFATFRLRLSTATNSPKVRRNCLTSTANIVSAPIPQTFEVFETSNVSRVICNYLDKITGKFN